MVDVQDDSINSRALKRIDDSVRDIILNAGQVAVYYFDSNLKSWKRKDIEGALFFVRRSTHPDHAFIVINRLNTVNLVQKITKDLELNLQEPYLLYKNNENEIYCVWFYLKEKCNELFIKINEIIETLKKNRFTPTLNNQMNGTMSINAGNPNSELLKKILFSDNNVNGKDSEPSTTPFVSNHGANSKSVSVTEKLSAPLHPTFVTPLKPKPITTPVIGLKSDLGKSSNRRTVNLKDLFDSQLTLVDTSPPKTTPNEFGDSLASQTELNNLRTLSTLNGSQFMTDDKKKSLVSNVFSTTNTTLTPSAFNPIAQQTIIANQPQKIVDQVKEMPKPLIPTSTVATPFDSIIQQGLQSNPSPGIPLEPSPSTAAAIVSKPPKTPNSDNPLYLSMEQLKKTLVYLLQNDADFLHSIHTAYVENIKK